MSIVQERYPTVESHLRRTEVSSLRHELLNTRSELLLQASHWASLHDARKNTEDVCILSGFSQRWSLEDVFAEQARAHLRQVERALIHILQASYGVCRECRQDIPFPKLKFEPFAVLCTACIEGRLDPLTADAL
jgi:RNA polymerase-binding transcription factor DksA